MSVTEIIAANLERVRGRIAAACERAARDPGEITLVAVTKYAEPEWVRALYELGIRDLGESRPQQLVPRVGQFPADVRWHMVGHLQRNKVRSVLETGAVIHSVDSLTLLERIERLAGELQVRPRILLEANISGEESKDGFSVPELQYWTHPFPVKSNVEIAGLMTMAPHGDDPESSRPAFRQLRELRDLMQTNVPALDLLPHLSMGMSGDFEVAIEEGATTVRLGSVLFEGLES